MKRAVLLLLALSLLVIGGCTASQLPNEAVNGAEEATPAGAAAEIDGMLLAEDSEVEIGEMV